MNSLLTYLLEKAIVGYVALSYIIAIGLGLFLLVVAISIPLAMAGGVIGAVCMGLVKLSEVVVAWLTGVA